MRTGLAAQAETTITSELGRLATAVLASQAPMRHRMLKIALAASIALAAGPAQTGAKTAGDALDRAIARGVVN